jgi:hypothetical protein
MVSGVVDVLDEFRGRAAERGRLERVIVGFVDV